MRAAMESSSAKSVTGAGPAAGSGTAEQTQVLTFMVDGEVFAIGILAIKEIIEYGAVTVVPMMPECIRGVINLRGSVVPVMDLSARFGRKAAVITKRTCIVIIELAPADGVRQTLGVIVDAVNAVLDIPPSEIEPPPSFGTKIRPDFIHGMGKVNGKFVILLSVNHVLSLGAVDVVDGSTPDEELSRAEVGAVEG